MTIPWTSSVYPCVELVHKQSERLSVPHLQGPHDSLQKLLPFSSLVPFSTMLRPRDIMDRSGA